MYVKRKDVIIAFKVFSDAELNMHHIVPGTILDTKSMTSDDKRMFTVFKHAEDAISLAVHMCMQTVCRVRVSGNVRELEGGRLLVQHMQVDCDGLIPLRKLLVTVNKGSANYGIYNEGTRNDVTTMLAAIMSVTGTSAHTIWAPLILALVISAIIIVATITMVT